MFNLPYMQRVLSDHDERKRFAQHYADLLNGDKYDEMCRLVDNLVTRWANLPRQDENKEKLSLLLAAIKAYVQAAERHMYPFFVIRLDVDGYLDDSDNVARLNSMMRSASAASDAGDCEEVVTNRLDISYCEGCDEWEFTDHMSGTYDDVDRCRSCIEHNWYWSEYHDTYVHTENARRALDRFGDEVWVHEDSDDFHYDEERDMYVHNSFEPPEPPILGSYHSSKSHQRPIPDDWSTQLHRWLGVELEVEVREGDRLEKVKELHAKINDGEIGKHVFFEQDGSLQSGFEVISQPMSLPKHRDLWSWLQDNAAVRGLRSHNTTTCGLHVHVNRDALSNIQVARIVTFINDPRNEPLIRAIARRYAEGYCKIKQKTLDNALESPDRYEAVNITSQKTVEFRIFKGTLKYESLMAAVEFANSLLDFSNKFKKAEELSHDNFMNFINTDLYKETNYLRPYIEQRLELA